MSTCSQAEFARLHGWNRAYVTELKHRGRLVLAEDGRVDVEASLARLAETADPAMRPVAERHAAARAGDIPAPEAPAAASGSAGSDSGEGAKGEAPEGSSGAYYEARARKEHYLALQAKLDYERQAAALVERAAVRRLAVELGTVFRSALERLPDQLAAPLAAESDTERVHALLVESVEQILRDVVSLGERRGAEIGGEA